jgi:dsDNA-specific endonuclease/ATPase MutS2
MSQDLSLFAASIDPTIPLIDLHEFRNSYEALEFLETELYQLYKKRAQYVRVIHGIGSGALKNQVHDALKNNPLVIDFELEKSGGSTVVILSK